MARGIYDRSVVQRQLSVNCHYYENLKRCKRLQCLIEEGVLCQQL